MVSLQNFVELAVPHGTACVRPSPALRLAILMNLLAGGRSSGNGSFRRQYMRQHLASAMQALAAGQARTGIASCSVFIFLQGRPRRRTFTVIQKRTRFWRPGRHWQAGANRNRAHGEMHRHAVPVPRPSIKQCSRLHHLLLRLRCRASRAGLPSFSGALSLWQGMRFTAGDWWFPRT